MITYTYAYRYASTILKYNVQNKLDAINNYKPNNEKLHNTFFAQIKKM